VPHKGHTMESQRMKDGTAFAEHIWWTLAKSIVKLAGELYEWDTDQWNTVNEMFLRPNDYKVILRHE
jgi:hypothetical protein